MGNGAQMHIFRKAVKGKRNQLDGKQSPDAHFQKSGERKKESTRWETEPKQVAISFEQPHDTLW